MLDVVFDYSEITEWANDMNILGTEFFPQAMKAAVTELGLFFEREAKMGAPVDSGRLKNSIGHGPDGVWAETFKKGTGYWVEIGTNVEYAPYMEFGFTMSKGHVAFIKKAGGFRYVHPFEFKGLHFFQKAANRTEKMLTATIQRHLDIAVARAGF